MEFVRSKDGTGIGYRRIGAGPALLFVHGMTADHMSWARVSPYLEAHFSILAMDRRGRGSSGDSPDYALRREVEDVVAIVQAVREPVRVLGHSFGGLLSLEAALLTDQIERLILYEPHVPDIIPAPPPTLLTQIQANIDRGELESAMELFLREVASIPDHELEFYRQMPLWKARVPQAATIPREMLVDRSYRFDPGRFAGLHLPSMLLLGEDSPPFARQAVEAVASALPNSRIVVLPGQQHMAHHTNPELFAKEVLDFLLTA
jgi:pimeloyl-ACP methyl ester carboxylesterase